MKDSNKDTPLSPGIIQKSSVYCNAQYYSTTRHKLYSSGYLRVTIRLVLELGFPLILLPVSLVQLGLWWGKIGLNDGCSEPIPLPDSRGKLTPSVSTYFKEVTLGEVDIEFGGLEEDPAIVWGGIRGVSMGLHDSRALMPMPRFFGASPGNVVWAEICDHEGNTNSFIWKRQRPGQQHSDNTLPSTARNKIWCKSCRTQWRHW